MNRPNGARWVLFCVAFLFLLIQGCASKIPSSLPLPKNEKPFVLDQLKKFQEKKCRQSFDADVTLEWQGFGKTEKIPGTLQLHSPAFLRYSVVDPLGRQLLILASDGSQFTLVDNRKAKALTGFTGSQFWQEYIPDFIFPDEYLAWITGQMSGSASGVQEIRRDMDSPTGVWLITDWEDSLRHHVLFYPRDEKILRHIVENVKNDILLDVMYSNYGKGEQVCSIPRLLQIQGEEISGTITIHFDEIFPEAPIPEKFFYLRIPDHFTRQVVE